MRWILFPPVISLLLLLPTALFHNRDAAVRLPAVIWGAVIAAYICLCCLSAYLISKKDGDSSSGVNFLAQGILLTAISVQSGSALLSWVGLVLFVIGLSLAFLSATNGSSMPEGTRGDIYDVDNSDVRERVDSLLAKFEMPICVTDAKGIVVAATPKFCEASGMREEEIVGEVISDVMPIDQDSVVFSSGKWWIAQTKEGARYYFSLLPTPDAKPPTPNAEPVKLGPPGIGIFDHDTGLYVEEYRILRGPQEISRSQRYKRSVAGIMLDLMFNPSVGVTVSDEESHMLFVAFAIRVKQALRIPDCGFLFPDRRIQLILPETPLAGAKVLLNRLVALPQDVFDEAVREAVHPKVKAGLFFYNGTTKMEYSIFSAALEEEFIKSKDGIAPPGEAA
ncbi:MAG: PAS domain-containing protein [Synergistaceae bacterium]|jgi:PAS domain-containing protein|nr:PAS domain-containing protein [Synergistaceae bacterium]